MGSSEQVLQRYTHIIEQMAALGPMRMGSVTEQMLSTKRKDGSSYLRGPYFSYTFKQGGKTRGRHLRNQEEAQLYRRQIDTFRQYQELSSELVKISQQLADQEAVGQQGGKKNFKR